MHPEYSTLYLIAVGAVIIIALNIIGEALRK